MGAAFLAPFVNRIRGHYLPATREIETQVATTTVRLPANGGGNGPGATKYAIHGFGGRWPSSLHFDFSIWLTSETFSAVLTATNTGSKPAPVGLGWHPYFNLPSGIRAQARMRLPASARLPVNNYDEVLPNGDVALVEGTAYDFRAAGGRELGTLYLDDCFVDLAKGSGGETVCDVIDPAAGYGLRIVSESPEITAIQTFAPPDRALVVMNLSLAGRIPMAPSGQLALRLGWCCCSPEVPQHTV